MTGFPDVPEASASGAPAAVRARFERAQSRSVFIATPMARHPVRQYTSALTQTCIRLSEIGIRCFVQTVVGNSNLPRARNELVAAFLASNYTDLLFVDDDMGWEPEAVVRLLASDKPLLGAVGSKKVMRPDSDPAKWCCRFWPDRPLRQDDFGNIEVESVGTGFLKIERRVFEAMIAAHPEWKRRGWPDMAEEKRAQYYRFFRFDHDDPNEIGEDYDFCKSWRALGGEVWIDPTIKLVHVGEWEFSGSIEALFVQEDAA